MTETLRKETSTPINRNSTTQSTTSIPQINPNKKRFPYCIVWTPLPLITSLIPCIGHTGICSSEGITHDFAGSYVVGVDNLSFGETHKYVQLEPNENEKQKWEKIYSYFEKKEVCILGFEEEVEHKTKYTSGKASYVERNHAMINDSDYCVFFYDEKYNPPKRKKSKKDLFEYQPKSGTKLAYNYAKQKRKIVLNILQL